VGDSALITRGGSCHGWVGGACTQSTVVREALAALADGRPRLLVLSPEPDAERRAGTSALPLTCRSGGSVDIYLEPIAPAPRLVVFGASPVAQAMARLAKATGYRVDAVEPGADRAAFPQADRVLAVLPPPEPRSGTVADREPVFAVVGTMGNGDEEAIVAALAHEPLYLGLIASRRRFAQIRDTLLSLGVPRQSIESIRCPAGLDIGAQTPDEIALSILAEIVSLRRVPELGQKELPVVTAGADPDERDPICGMTVTAASPHQAEFGGRVYRFCCAGCHQRFVADPARYSAAAAEPPR
jgi:xanthine dehydrogenase accessory factor